MSRTCATAQTQTLHLPQLVEYHRAAHFATGVCVHSALVWSCRTASPFAERRARSSSFHAPNRRATLLRFTMSELVELHCERTPTQSLSPHARARALAWPCASRTHARHT
eukprot:14298-Pleurochrysis_carterae.AAC.1